MKKENKKYSGPTDYEKQASRKLRGKLVDLGISYDNLSEMLINLGVEKRGDLIGRQIRKGNFPYSFYLQCKDVIEKGKKMSPDN